MTQLCHSGAGRNPGKEKMIIYRALYSVLKVLCRWGMRLTLAWADVRPFWTSCKKMRLFVESALIVRIFLPVSYLKVLPSMVFTRRFSSLTTAGLSAATMICGAAELLGLSQAKAIAGNKIRMMDRMVFMEVILT